MKLGRLVSFAINWPDGSSRSIEINETVKRRMAIVADRDNWNAKTGWILFSITLSSLVDDLRRTKKSMVPVVINDLLDLRVALVGFL